MMKSPNESDLKLSEARFKAAITAVAGVVWTNDAAGRMLGDQPGWSALTGQTRAEYANYGWANAVHPDDAQPTLEAWDQAVAEKRPFKFEHRLRTAACEWRIFCVHAIPVINSNGDIQEWVGVHTDVTEERQQKEELRKLAAELSEASQRKSEFLAVLAHELRNPLAPIRTGLDLIAISEENPVVIRRVREMMGRQVTQMVHLIDDLLDIARITSGKVELKCKVARLDEIIASALEASGSTLHAKQHSLVTSLPDEPFFLYVDSTRIAQVLDNLLTNAAKYTPNGGTIKLSAYGAENCITIEVTDNGLGIPAYAIDSVFDMFSQVNVHLGRGQGGLGIGLSIVKKLIELHGGSVRATSEGSGYGTTFSVTLPLTTRPEALEAFQPPKSDLILSITPLKIIVADDNLDAADSLAALLRERCHNVFVANDGDDALVKTCEIVPDLVFLDIGMPGLTGLEVARALRRNPAYDRMVLVALTGWGTETDRLGTSDAGFDHHLTKPIALADVDKLLYMVFANTKIR